MIFSAVWREHTGGFFLILIHPSLIHANCPGTNLKQISATTSTRKFNTMDEAPYLHQDGHSEAWTFTQYKRASWLSDISNSNRLPKALKCTSQPVTYDITDESVRNFLSLYVHSNKISIPSAVIKYFLQTF